MRLALAPIFLAAVLASPVYADNVLLQNGRVIKCAHASYEGDEVLIELERGSTRIPRDEVKDIIPTASRQELVDQLAARKLAAKDDPAKLRELSRWCRANGLPREGDDLLAAAKGIELDRRLDDLKGSTTVAPYLALARTMKGEYTDSERRVVLERALTVDPENAEVHVELGEAKRDGRWVSLAEAARLDAAAEEREMTARGYVKYDGRWVTPEERSLAEERKALAREREALRREREQAAADLAAIERAKQDERARREAEQDAPYKIDVMPDYDELFNRDGYRSYPWNRAYGGNCYRGYDYGYAGGTLTIVGPGRGSVTYGPGFGPLVGRTPNPTVTVTRAPAPPVTRSPSPPVRVVVGSAGSAESKR